MGERIGQRRAASAGEPTDVAHLDSETRAAIEDGLAQAKRGEFASDEEVAKADARWGLGKP